MTSKLCYCIEEDCPLQHGHLPPAVEFPPGLCVDCGMSVPAGEIICDQCKAAWQLFSFTGDVGRRGDTTLQPGAQELQGQDAMQLVSPEEAHDVQIRNSQEG